MKPKLYPRISIITVVFNSEKFVERTIKSVLQAKQYYSNIEYVIIDGKSNDNTLLIIEKYKNYVDILISEKDYGLYDAMNKGLKNSTGEYVWFLNSGDKIFEDETIFNIFNTEPIFCDVYYGETIMVDELGNELGMRRLQTPNNLNWKSFKRGMKVSHQSIIFRKKLTVNYDLKYKFSADFDWCIKALKQAKTVKNTKLIFTSYLDGGLTKKNIVAGLKERFKIMKFHYGLISTLLNHIPLAFQFLFYVIKNKRF